MAILTHGSHTDGIPRIMFKDGSHMKLNDVMDQFKNINCINLLRKPKVFLFPFCRGDTPDHGSFVTRPSRPITSREFEHDGAPYVENDGQMEDKCSTYSDILICYATVVGFQTHRDVQDGSWYVQNIVRLWAEHAHDTHVEDLAKMVGSGESVG
jgi:caspase Dronc